MGLACIEGTELLERKSSVLVPEELRHKQSFLSKQGPLGGNAKEAEGICSTGTHIGSSWKAGSGRLEPAGAGWQEPTYASFSNSAFGDVVMVA